MRILAIESSCDETAAAVIEGAGKLRTAERAGESGRFWAIEGVDSAGNPRILSNVVVSQVDIFAAYGGVIPEVAARSHLEAMLPVVQQALDEAGVTKEGIDAIAVTYAPGLLGSLLIGTLTARTLAILWRKPLLAVHHLKSHIYANWLNTEVKPEFPLLALVVSGGHTQIIYMGEHNQFEIIGTTRDDAVGECFDKVAKILGLPYPGGSSIAKCALGQSYVLPSETVARSSSKESDLRQPKDSLQTAPTSDSAQLGDSSQKTSMLDQAPIGDSKAYRLPHPQVEGLDFSFSGLKTAVLRAVQAELGVPITTPSFELAGKLSAQQRADFAASFQATAVEILIEKLQKALAERPEAKSIVLAGGVSASQALRERAQQVFGAACVYVPELKLTGDNAAMVGAAAYYEILSGVPGVDSYALDIAPRVPIS